MSSLEAKIPELQTLILDTRTSLNCLCSLFGVTSTEKIIITEEVTAIVTKAYCVMIVFVNILWTGIPFEPITTTRQCLADSLTISFYEMFKLFA